MHLSLEEIRKNKLKQLNFNPYQQKRFFRNTNIKCIIDSFSFFKKEDLSKLNQKVRMAGRLLRMRDFGRLIFSILADQTGSIQLKIVNKKDFLELDLGDIIGLEGKVCKTDKGELSIDVEEFILLSKCLKPLPDTHYGFIDIEQRLSKRYLDFMMNPKNRDVLITRHKVVKNIRRFLDEKNYIEIETPILVDSSSGALAKPFFTRHNKMRKNFYLRIATEIHLKMLLVGGFEKIYEIGRIFRNEGIDSRHNPEFTSIEIYNAYENSQYMINLTEELFHFLVSDVLKKKKIRFNFHTIDLSLSFHRISMIDSVKKYCGVDFGLIGDDLEKALEIVRLHDIKLEDFQYSVGHILLIFFEKYVEKNLIEPTFVYDLPLIVSPLAKAADNNSTIIAERFELYISGVEFANGYSELNDPLEQRKRFEEQVKQKASGNEEISDFDQAFIEALEYGMPPAAGLGIGIERLIMLLTEKDNIREVMAFSQIK